MMPSPRKTVLSSTTALEVTRNTTAPYQGTIIDLAGIVVPNSERKEINPIYLNNHRPITFVIDEEKTFVLPQSDITDAAVPP